MNPEKPGWLTTEFATTLGLNLIAVLKTLGWLPAHDVSSVEGWWKEIVATAGLLISGVFTAIWYIKGRVELKKARMLASSNGTTTINASV